MLVLVALVLPGLLAARPRQLGYSYELDTPGAGVRYRGDISGVVGPSIALPTLNMPSVTTMVRPILRTQFQWFFSRTFIVLFIYAGWRWRSGVLSRFFQSQYLYGSTENL